MTKYFDDSFKKIFHTKQKNIKTLLRDDMILISGDFWGIQKFIFEKLASKNASKVIRAKSAFIQIYTEYIAKYICYRLDIDETYILNNTAGKFEILSPNKDRTILNDIQKKIDNYFLTNFYGLSGITICATECIKNDFVSTKAYKEFRNRVLKTVEIEKFKKFDLINQENFLIKYDKDIDNSSLCRICNIRKVEDENCNICNVFIQLGKLLVKREQSIISSDTLQITIDNFLIDITIDKRLKFYVSKEDFDTPATFETLANNSCEEGKGIKALGILKADVDSMGKYLKESDITENFENFEYFSHTLNNFFSLYIPIILKEKYPDTYTVFAGGDDLFLIGAWDEIVALAREIHQEFQTFIRNKLSISFGIVVVKPSYPVDRFAFVSEEMLENAKAIDEDKNAITLFGETVKWKSYLATFSNLNEAFKDLTLDETKTAFLYRLLEVVELSKKVKYDNDIEATIWKSKLSYSFHRNMDAKYENLLKVLYEEIDMYPKESKIFLSEFIYKRRVV